jgi:hypothetical protein
MGLLHPSALLLVHYFEIPPPPVLWMELMREFELVEVDYSVQNSWMDVPMAKETLVAN